MKTLNFGTGNVFIQGGVIGGMGEILLHDIPNSVREQLGLCSGNQETVDKLYELGNRPCVECNFLTPVSLLNLIEVALSVYNNMDIPAPLVLISNPINTAND